LVNVQEIDFEKRSVQAAARMYYVDNYSFLNESFADATLRVTVSLPRADIFRVENSSKQHRRHFYSKFAVHIIA